MITHARKIDMYPASVPVVIHLSQYDDDFTIEFTLYSSVGTFTVESGTTAKIRGTKKDGNGYSANASIDTTQKKVTVTGNQQMTAIAGRNVYELVLTKNNKVLSTANFILDVEPAAMDASTVPSESVIQEIGESVNVYLDEHPEMVYQVDDTLSVAGAAADAKKTGDEIADLKSDLSQQIAITPEIRDALLACFRNVAWSTQNGRTLYETLERLMDKDPFQPYAFSFADADNYIGGLKPSGAEDWASVHHNTLSNRANLVSLIPFTEGTISAKRGYKITAYKITDRDVQFRYFVENDQINEDTCGVYLGASPYSYPEWEDSVSIVSTDNCRFVWVAFKKTSDANWTSEEMRTAWGTVYTSNAQLPTLADILTITNRYSLKPWIIGTLGGVTKFRIDSSAELTSRARTNFLPLTKGSIVSADNSKYQICMYQVDNHGFYIQDSQNPTQSDGFPAWSDSFTIHSGIGVFVAFKKLDGTDFTADEIANAYGTIFDYVEAE